MTRTRDEVRTALQEGLVGVPGVLAVWEAGSSAFDRVDAYSDLDIGVLAEQGAGAAVWERVERVFTRLGGLELRWHEPNPVFKGLDKATFRLREASRWLQVDLGIFTHPAASLYNEPPRHGRHRVLHDPLGLAAPPAWDAEAHRGALARALHHLIQKQALYYDFFAKELARGRSVDAWRMYQAYCVDPAVAALGMLHRPERWDFGLRYVHSDLPPEEALAVQRLCYVGTTEELSARAAEADALFRRTVVLLVRGGLVPEGDERDIGPEWLRRALQ